MWNYYDGKTRNDVYHRAHSGFGKNMRIIEKPSEDRKDMSRIRGYATFAQTKTAKIFGTNENLEQFLLDVWKALEPISQKQIEILADAKFEKEGDRNIYAWDYEYYKKIVRNQISLPIDINQYFSLRNCLNGLSIVVRNLFEMELQFSEVDVSDKWAPHIIKADVIDRSQTLVSTIYFDLLYRENKDTSSITYQLQPALMKNNGKEFQPAIAGVSLSLSNSPDVNKSMMMNTDDICRNVTLNFGDVLALFHEFGHAMAISLSKTETQHVSGSRGSLELAEVPSTLFEKLASDYRVLSQFALHPVTRAPLPRDYFDSLTQNRKQFSGIFAQAQLAASVFDHRIHSKKILEEYIPGELPSLDMRIGRLGDPTGEVMEAVEKIFDQTQKQFSPVPIPPGTNWLAKFHHLMTYGGCYHSYIFADVITCIIWDRLFAEDPLSRKSGQLLYDCMLKYGSSRHPQHVLRDLTGEEFPFSIEPYARSFL
eukprot:TRINITY_DN13143_c0_g1_i1.p1 TRINITY_DN13143_c0_g1~~TRINITY_DN13143_c0_g1_i1.p1  ORF type:complete len:481 (-),score=89.53 TRINITY_DN13143_c0_g1_i1:53-1495(-)